LVGLFEDIDGQLKEKFLNVNFPTNEASFFYDWTPHLSDSGLYSHYCLDTISMEDYFVVHKEIEYSLYSGYSIMPDSILYDTARRFQSDTISIGFIDFNFHKLKDDALNSSKYYQMDSSNSGGVKDIPSQYVTSSPYIDSNVFIMGVFREYSYFKDMVFRLSPETFFIDQFNEPGYTGNESGVLKINFGDGAGWQIVNYTSDNYYYVNYSDSGQKYIELGLFDNTGTNQLKSSKGTLKVLKNEQIPYPMLSFDLDGINVGFYPPCNFDPGEPQKYIIYLEGIDVLENVNIPQIFENGIQNTRLHQLRNHGYGFMVVDWKKSTKDIRDNAAHVVDLLQWLKCPDKFDLQAIEGPAHQFVIIGESMGGIVGRYALAWMESNAEELECANELNHNTRLLITVDSPHQGAIIPLSMQHLLDDGILNSLFGMGTIADIVIARKFLRSPAATQLLALHVDNKVGDTYFNHNNRTTFLNDINELFLGESNTLGFCKEVAISSGDLRGNPQITGDDEIDALSNIITLDKVISIRFLNLQRDISRKEFLLNVNGVGEIYSNNFSLNLISININFCGPITLGWCPLCFQFSFPCGINVTDDWKQIYNQSEDSDMECFECLPGGFYSFDLPSQATMDNVNIVANVLRKIVYMPGFVAYSLTREIDKFCFIPIHSALNYGNLMIGFPSYFPDILNQTPTINMAMTNFDLITGQYFGDNSNRNHVFFRNHTLSSSFSPPFEFPTLSNGLESSFLNREIGEEVMHIEGFSINRDAIFQAENDIFHGQTTNPHYSYPSSPTPVVRILGAPSNTNGIFSTDDQFTVGSGFTAELVSDIQEVDLGTIGSYNWTDEEQSVCNIYTKHELILSSRNHETFEDEIKIFPNPSNGYLQIEGKVKSIELYNGMGQIINFSNRFESNNFQIKEKGLYFLKTIDDKNNIRTFKIIVK